MLAGSDALQNLQKRKQLVLCTIVCLRWPMVEEALMENLEYVDAIQLKAPVKEVSEQLQRLFNDAPGIHETS